MTHLFDIERPIAFFHEKDSWFYRNYDGEARTSMIEYRTLNGETINAVKEENNRYIRYIAYEPITDRYFLISNNNENKIEVHTLKPDTLEVKQSGYEWKGKSNSSVFRRTENC